MKAWLPFLLACEVTIQAGELSHRAELLVSSSHYKVDPDSSWNPRNRIVQQPDQVLAAEWRTDLGWLNDLWAIVVKPRLLAEDSSRGSEAWLNEAWVRLRPWDRLSVHAGREALLWGPAFFWNPSNPFFGERVRGGPRREINGKTFLRGRWQWDDRWALETIAQLDNGHDSLGPERSQALKLGRTGSETDAALIVSRRPGTRAEIRGYGQWTANDACLLYGESAWAERAPLPLARLGPTGWRIERRESRKALELVVGGAWTFEDGRTLSAEFFHHGSGYARQELRSLEAMATALAAQLEGRNGRLALGQLAGILDPGISPLGRDACGLQWREGSGQTFDWTVRYARSLHDHSGEIALQLLFNLGDRVQVWGHVQVQHGGADREYGRWLRSSATIGASWFLP